MNASALVTKAVSTFAGCVLLLAASVAQAEFPMADQLGRFDVHGLGGDIGNAIPLFAVKLSATTDLMKGNALDITASYRSVTLDQNGVDLSYNELSTEFSVAAPRLKSMDFSQSIREKVEVCPEKLLDKLIIDGALGFNYQW